MGPRGLSDPPPPPPLEREVPVEPEPAVLEERRPSASSRGRALPRRGSPRRLAVPGGFALAIADLMKL